MKISRKVGLILGAVILIAALVVVCMLYFRETGERERLNDKLSSAQDRLPTLIIQKGDLEKQLAQAESLLDTSRAQFPQAVESIEYGEYIFEIAESCSVTLASLAFPKPVNRTEGSVTYSVVSLSLPVSGELANIFEFIDIIRTDPRFASTQVKTVSLAGGSATISVDIYAWKG